MKEKFISKNDGSGSCQISQDYVFLFRFFNNLNYNNIQYAVMRNYETLPFSAAGSDIDILISRRDEALAKSLLIETLKDANGVVIGSANTNGFCKVNTIGRSPSSLYPWWGLSLDLNVGITFKGHILIETNVFLPANTHQGIVVLPQEIACVLGVLKEILNNGIFPVRYANALKSAAIHKWPQMETKLKPLGKLALDRLQSLLIGDKAPEKLRQECFKIRRDVLRHAIARDPVMYALRTIRYEFSKAWRYFRPSGIVLAILGVDGAGKSTIINAILPALQAATHNAIFIKHLRPGLLPPLARLKGKRNESASTVLTPHSSKPSGKVGSFFRLCYLTLDYIIGYWVIIRPKIAKQPAIILYDRYAYDLLMDPRRFRIRLSSRLTGWFASLAPKPDLIFCLQGDPKTLAARKRELSAKETCRQIEALRSFAELEPRAVLISSDTSIEETRDQVLQKFYEFLQKKPSCVEK